MSVHADGETRYTQAEQAVAISSETTNIGTTPTNIITRKVATAGGGVVYRWWPNPANGIKGEARLRD